MSWKLAVQAQSGRVQFSVEPHNTISELKGMVHEKCNVLPLKQKLTYGFPPSDLCAANPSVTLQDAGVKNGDMLRLSEKSEEDLRADLNKLESYTTGSGRTFRRHVIPADNSCLFTSVGLLLDHGRSGIAHELRELIAGVVLSNPDFYCDAVLGKSNDDYCSWIQKDQSWGGGIELGILSQHYETEICAIDVSHVQVYRFGEDKQYKKRAIVMYDGIHYDAMVECKGDKEVGAFDIGDDEALEACVHVVKGLHDARQFTDTSAFSLKCLVCGQGLLGAQAAQEHAVSTGHTNFAEYS